MSNVWYSCEVMADIKKIHSDEKKEGKNGNKKDCMQKFEWLQHDILIYVLAKSYIRNIFKGTTQEKKYTEAQRRWQWQPTAIVLHLQ